MSALAEFYDERIDSRPDLAERYWPLYKAAAALVPRGARVVELGCGTGEFAAYVMGRVSSYLGLDFSSQAIEGARKRLPGIRFRVADLRKDWIPDRDTYVTLEVLEHLDDDLALLDRLPRGAEVILSVPSFDSASHVRFFPEKGDARRRYKGRLHIDHERYVTLPNGAFFHLLRGTL